MASPDDTPDRRSSDVLHRLVLNRLDSLERSIEGNREAIERKIDLTFEDVSERVVKLETKVADLASWRDLQQMHADIKAARAERIAGRLDRLRQWVTFGVGTAAGVIGVLVASHGL